MHAFRRSDLVWVLAYPLYQIIGTVRHEACHAAAVMLEGGRVTRFVFWPTTDRGFLWGYVTWQGAADWLVSAAPYFGDLLTFVVCYALCTRVRFRRHWLWVNIAIIGLISPLVNSAYRYVSSFFRDGDLARVYAEVPAGAVHAYFIGTIALYIVLLVRISRRDRSVRP